MRIVDNQMQRRQTFFRTISVKMVDSKSRQKIFSTRRKNLPVNVSRANEIDHFERKPIRRRARADHRAHHRATTKRRSGCM
jgi:hypothetical protein